MKYPGEARYLKTVTSGTGYEARQYRLSPPLKGHYLVLAVATFGAGVNGVFICGCDEDGRRAFNETLPGSYVGGIDFEEALRGAGYAIVD